jgi:hypothetical protein
MYRFFGLLMYKLKNRCVYVIFAMLEIMMIHIKLNYIYISLIAGRFTQIE